VTNAVMSSVPSLGYIGSYALANVLLTITERVSPRIFRLNAFPTPSDREKTRFYGQRYIERFPAAGEIVLFDRSWYHRAGVERWHTNHRRRAYAW